MATKVFDGFDHYNAAADFTSRSGWLQWQAYQLFSGPVGAQQCSFVTGRNGIGKALALTTQTVGGSGQGNYYAAIFQDRNPEAYVGFSALLVSGQGMWVFLIDTVANKIQLAVHFNELNYSVAVYSGGADGSVTGAGTGTLLGVTGNNVWPGDVWNFVEFHPVIAASGAGSLQIKVRGDVVLTLSSVTTNISGNAWFDAMAFITSPAWSNHVLYLDDLYYNDTTTGPGLTPMNGYAGDGAVRTLFVVGNDSVSWTPFALSNFNEVSETAMESDTSYNSTSTVGNEDRFNLQTITSALNTMYAVQVTGAYRKDDGGVRTIQQAVKSGSTESFGATHSLPDTSYAYFTDMWVLNPATGLNWTKTDINAMKAAYKLTA